MVTAEFAVTITGVVFVLMLCLTAVATGIDHIRCAEASRVGARLAARAEPSGAIVAAAREAAPRGATVTLSAGELQLFLEGAALPLNPRARHRKVESQR